jgi:aquaporin Z
MRKYVTEFIGTFGLVFTVGCAVMSGSPLAPLAIGAALMVLVYAGGHISGAHYNPAVTLGVFLRGKLPLTEVGPYWAAQLGAAFLAAWLAKFTVHPGFVHTLSTSGVHAILSALFAEFFFTFALVYVVLNVATSKDQPGNQFFGLAIGFTVASGAFAVGGVSGAAFNPAVAFGAMLMGLLNWGNFYIYLIAGLLGAVVAALAFTYLKPDDVLEGPLVRWRGMAADWLPATVTATATGPATPAAPTTPAGSANPVESARRTGLAARAGRAGRAGLARRAGRATDQTVPDQAVQAGPDQAGPDQATHPPEPPSGGAPTG